MAVNFTVSVKGTSRSLLKILYGCFGRRLETSDLLRVAQSRRFVVLSHDALGFSAYLSGARCHCTVARLGANAAVACAPRNFGPRACWALLSSDLNTVDFNGRCSVASVQARIRLRCV